ncbi:MAG: 50S ribosomal protein L25 [Ignavibacteria bacterium]|nr:50S ribosomal protein L25 [Ignavibacteria bacterium]
MEKVVLQASVRTEFSKSGRGQLRRNGKVPGILYAKTVEPIPVTVLENSINPLVFTAESHVINLQLDNGTQVDCVIKDIQFDPVTDRVIHFDLQGLVSGEKLEIEIPVVITGSSIGVRDGGLLQQFLHKIKIECLPSDIPEHVEVDVTALGMGHAVHVSDLKIAGAEILHTPETVVVSVSHPRSAEEAADGEGRTEPEVIAKGKEKQTEE